MSFHNLGILFQTWDQDATQSIDGNRLHCRVSVQLLPLVSKWISSVFPNVEIRYYVLFLW